MSEDNNNIHQETPLQYLQPHSRHRTSPVPPPLPPQLPGKVEPPKNLAIPTDTRSRTSSERITLELQRLQEHTTGPFTGPQVPSNSESISPFKLHPVLNPCDYTPTSGEQVFPSPSVYSKHYSIPKFKHFSTPSLKAPRESSGSDFQSQPEEIQPEEMSSTEQSSAWKHLRWCLGGLTAVTALAALVLSIMLYVRISDTNPAPSQPTSSGVYSPRLSSSKVSKPTTSIDEDGPTATDEASHTKVPSKSSSHAVHTSTSEAARTSEGKQTSSKSTSSSVKSTTEETKTSATSTSASTTSTASSTSSRKNDIRGNPFTVATRTDAKYTMTIYTTTTTTITSTITMPTTHHMSPTIDASVSVTPSSGAERLCVLPILTWLVKCYKRSRFQSRSAYGSMSQRCWETSQSFPPPVVSALTDSKLDDDVERIEHMPSTLSVVDSTCFFNDTLFIEL